jgi:hypothetical protein
MALQHPLDGPHVLHDPLIDLTGARGLAGAKEDGVRKDCDMSSGCDMEEEVEQFHL